MTRQGEITRAALLFAIAVASFPAASSAAVSHAGGFTYVRNSVSGRHGPPVTGRASCPTGTHVLGGGEGPDQADHQTHTLLHSYPYDGDDVDRKPDDGWKARVRTGKRFTVYAVCAPLMPTYERAKAGLQVNQRSGSMATACGDTESILAGGTSGPDKTVEVVSYPDGPVNNRWVWDIDNHTVSHEPTVHLIAICASLAPTYPTAAGTVLPQGYATASASCAPPASHVIAGGESNTGTFSTVTQSLSRPTFFAGPQTDEWLVGVNDTDPINAFGFAAYAVCLPTLN